jgi:hypothetical protein
MKQGKRVESGLRKINLRSMNSEPGAVSQILMHSWPNTKPMSMNFEIATCILGGLKKAYLLCVKCQVMPSEHI